ncbi:uncharacterized protein G2W53_017403 [Senna tora]|uniref:Uncharacterized protein n=1 Tax=Senna tora TaxID=362788 RepID=A0A834TR65_9FABA|nr:uncharacterized protein G2W53_017403 [Senna tora]
MGLFLGKDQNVGFNGLLFFQWQDFPEILLNYFILKKGWSKSPRGNHWRMDE